MIIRNIILGIEDHHYDKLMDLANRLEMKIPKQYKTVDLSNCLEILRQSDDSELNKKAMDLTLENFNAVSVDYKCIHNIIYKMVILLFFNFISVSVAHNTRLSDSSSHRCDRNFKIERFGHAFRRKRIQCFEIMGKL